MAKMPAIKLFPVQRYQEMTSKHDRYWAKDLCTKISHTRERKQRTERFLLYLRSTREIKINEPISSDKSNNLFFQSKAKRLNLNST